MLESDLGIHLFVQYLSLSPIN